MAGVFIRISGTMAAWALGMALIAAQQAGAEGPAAQPPVLQRSDLAQAALQQASALIEKYVQPVAEPEPTPKQKRAIESAMKLLKSEQAMKGQSAIERFLQIGAAALGELRRLASTAPAENSTGGDPNADAYPATMAAIIIRRIETAQRQPILQELISLGDSAQAVVSLKLNENEAVATAAKSRIEAATAALIKAAADTALDAPAVATERNALEEAQSAQNQVQARRAMLMELRRLMAPKPPAQPQAPPEEQPQPAIPPADVLNIQPLEPPTSSTPYLVMLQSMGGPFDGDNDDTGAVVNVYSQRGAASRGAAHRGGGRGGSRSAAQPGGGGAAGGRGGGGEEKGKR